MPTCVVALTSSWSASMVRSREESTRVKPRAESWNTARIWRTGLWSRRPCECKWRILQIWRKLDGFAILNLISVQVRWSARGWTVPSRDAWAYLSDQLFFLKLQNLTIRWPIMITMLITTTHHIQFNKLFLFDVFSIDGWQLSLFMVGNFYYLMVGNFHHLMVGNYYYLMVGNFHYFILVVFFFTLYFWIGQNHIFIIWWWATFIIWW